MQLHDALFDAVFGDQSVHGHGALLADAVCAIGRLSFHSRVPPGVGVDHVVGSGEVQPKAPRLQANQEQWRVPVLKRGHPRLALRLRRAAIEVLVANRALVQVLA